MKNDSEKWKTCQKAIFSKYFFKGAMNSRNMAPQIRNSRNVAPQIMNSWCLLQQMEQHISGILDLWQHILGIPDLWCHISGIPDLLLAPFKKSPFVAGHFWNAWFVTDSFEEVFRKNRFLACFPILWADFWFLTLLQSIDIQILQQQKMVQNAHSCLLNKWKSNDR